MIFAKKIKILEKLYEINELKNIYGGSPNLLVSGVSNIENAKSGDLIWVGLSGEKLSKILRYSKASVIVCGNRCPDIHSFANPNKMIIVSSNPKLMFIKLIDEVRNEKSIGIHPSAIISPEAVIGSNVYIGAMSVVNKAVIGSGVRIGCNVKIDDRVSIGSETIVHSNVIIGEPGFNYATDENDIHHSFPHLGGVEIGENCELSASCFVSSGGLGPTVIEDGTKIAQFAYIGANTKVGKNCQIRARATVLGSVRLGKNTVVGPAAIIRDSLNIGERALIGMGSNVICDINDDEIWYGNPAKRKLDK